MRRTRPSSVTQRARAMTGPIFVMGRETRNLLAGERARVDPEIVDQACEVRIGGVNRTANPILIGLTQAVWAEAQAVSLGFQDSVQIVAQERLGKYTAT